MWGWLGLSRRFGPVCEGLRRGMSWRDAACLTGVWAARLKSFNSSTSKYKIRSINSIRGKTETWSSHRIVSRSSPSRKHAPKAASGQISWGTSSRKSSTYCRKSQSQPLTSFYRSVVLSYTTREELKTTLITQNRIIYWLKPNMETWRPITTMGQNTLYIDRTN